MAKKKKIGELLVSRGVITEHVLKQALAEQRIVSQKLGEILVERGWAKAYQINEAIASQMETELVSIADYVIEFEILSLVGENQARKFKAMPLFKHEDVLTVAMTDPNDVFALDQLQRKSGYKIKPMLATETDISWAIEHYYKTSGSVEDVIAAIDKDELEKGDRSQEANILKLVNLLISKAVHDKASDIHIEPEEKTVNVRYRIDGILRKRYVLPKFIQSAVSSRIKILSDLDVSEKRLPQDGRIRMNIEAKQIDFRVSVCPMIYGENVVLRILDKSGLVLGLDSLGFRKRELELFKKLLLSPYGIMLVTGPTGSGKTTTLYSGLQILNKEDVNVMTVEDPVEFQFHRMRQVQMKPSIGLTFASALRSFLRQDPDIIMVGEIRDLETAQISVQAALTGHLVLSTLHTNDSSSAFTRLIDMGIEPFLVSSSILGVLAQRLVRVVCKKCKKEYEPSPEILETLELDPNDHKGVKFYKGQGCKNCNGTGYKGRVGIYELLKNSKSIQDLILKRASVSQIRRVACQEGLVTLRQAAINKLLTGETSVEEVLRVTQEINV